MDEQQDTQFNVPLDEAFAQMEIIEDYDPGDGPKPCVHTFVDSPFGLIGAHWSVESLRALVEECGIEASGAEATAMGHGLVVIRPAPHGPLFIATKATA